MSQPEPVQDEHVADADASNPGETEQPAVQENRAARRAKGKVTSPQPFGKGQHFGGRGSVQSPRQYGNRRSG